MTRTCGVRRIEASRCGVSGWASGSLSAAAWICASVMASARRQSWRVFFMVLCRGAQRLGCSQDGFPDRLRQGNGAEKRLRIEIIVAGFIDDPHQSMLLRFGIAEHDVDLPPFERS